MQAKKTYEGVELQVHAFLTLKRSPQYLLNRRYSGPLSQPECFGKDKISCPCEELNDGLSLISSQAHYYTDYVYDALTENTV